MKVLPHAILILLMLCLAPADGLGKKKKNSEPRKGNTIENFLRPPKAFGMTMSPDGKYAASVAPIGEKGDRGLVVIDLDTMSVKRSFSVAGRSISQATWVGNDHIAFTRGIWDRWADGLFALDVENDEITQLLKNDVAASIIHPLHESTKAWIKINSPYQNQGGIALLEITGDVIYREGVHFRTYKTVDNPFLSNRIANPSGEIFWWGIDNNGVPRIVYRFEKGKLEYLHRKTADEKFAPLPIDAEEWAPEVFSDDPNILYISGYNGENTKGLYSYNIAKNVIGPVEFRDPKYDFSDSVQYHRFKGKVVGFRYMADKPKFVWLEPNLASIQSMIDGTLKDTENVIYDSSDDFSRHLIYSYSDRTPPTYNFLDLKAKSLKLITESAPWLEKEKLVPTQTFHFKTSDGLLLEGYLTRPTNKGGPLPTICIVHGGPWARDTNSYNDETQLFVKNGYAVVRINFRGSTGFGRKISYIPSYAFRKMQDDITEGVKMLIDQKIADPDRIAIMGASFGGYSAICGAAFEPDLYRCAITNMGVFDWEELIRSRKSQRHYYSHYKLLEQLGSPNEDQKRFEDISPIYHIDKIKVPIMVIHGKEDQNVEIKQSKLLKRELEKHGVDHEIHFVKNEGHNIFSLKNRVETYKHILAFLKENMK